MIKGMSMKMLSKRLLFVLVGSAFMVSTALADIAQVRVVNDTDSTVYIHKGGYAPSVRIPAGQWKIFTYPFHVVPPGSKQRISSSLIVATAGGRWITSPNGMTSLSKPKMIICLDYKSDEHKHKTGNRVWTIKRAQGFDPGCEIKPYKQPWHQQKTKQPQQ